MKNHELLKQCIESSSLSQGRTSSELEQLIRFGILIGSSPSLCLGLYDFYQSDAQRYDASGSGIPKFFAYKENAVIRFSADGKDFSLPSSEFFVFLGLVSDACLPVLPLGSVVSIRDERLRQGTKTGTEELPNMEIPVLITERFSVLPGTLIYFPYGGVPYPFGAITKNGALYFGPQSIRETVFTGYSDALEEEFESKIREELLLKKKFHSMAFASKEEIQNIDEAAINALGN